jgi:hypothetical protein
MIEPLGVWTYAPLHGELSKVSKSRDLPHYGI